MNWYIAEDKRKSVHEVVIDVQNPQPQASKFGTLVLGTKYHPLRTLVWTIGFFRLENDHGPYLLVRADSTIDRLRAQQFRVAFCFYHMKAGGLISLFVDFPSIKIPGNPYDPFVLFEMTRGIDVEDERQRISDAFSRPSLHVCFAQGEGPGKNLGSGVWVGTGITASYDVLVDLSAECRSALDREWKSLLRYHQSVPSSQRDFQTSFAQMQQENPLSENPILGRSDAPEQATTVTQPGKRWWAFWK